MNEGVWIISIYDLFTSVQFYTCSLIVCLWCSTLGSVLDLPVESEPDQADAEEDQLDSGWEETAGSAAEGLQTKAAQNNNITVL